MRTLLATRKRRTTDRVLAFKGDSNTAIGAFVPAGQEWAAIAAAIIDPDAEYHNTAVSGYTIEQMRDTAATTVDIYRTETAIVNVSIVMGGTNGGNLDPFIKYEQMKQFIAARIAARFDRIFVLPYLRSGDVSTDLGRAAEGRRALYRDYLLNDKDNGRTFFVIDHDAVPELMDPLNATYFFESPDLTHMKAPGHLALGNFAGAEIAARL